MPQSPKRRKEWMIENAERVRQYKRKYWLENREQVNKRAVERRQANGYAKDKAYYRKNRAVIRQKQNAKRRAASNEWKQEQYQVSKKWKLENKERWKVHRLQGERTRRALERGATGVWSNQKWIWRCEFYGWRCAYCRREVDLATVTQDHAIPLSKGGTQWPSNLLPACLNCNSQKHASKWKDWKKPRFVQ